jgi:hypothetical protein
MALSWIAWRISRQSVAIMFGSAGYVKNHLKDCFADLFDRGVAVGDSAWIVPASMSIRPDQRSASEVRDESSMTGAMASPKGAPRSVVKTCIFMEAASCRVPQTKSLAGVAAKISPLVLTFSPYP